MESPAAGAEADEGGGCLAAMAGYPLLAMRCRIPNQLRPDTPAGRGSYLEDQPAVADPTAPPSCPSSRARRPTQVPRGRSTGGDRPVVPLAVGEIREAQRVLPLRMGWSGLGRW